MYFLLYKKLRCPPFPRRQSIIYLFQYHFYRIHRLEMLSQSNFHISWHPNTIAQNAQSFSVYSDLMNSDRKVTCSVKPNISVTARQIYDIIVQASYDGLKLLKLRVLNVNVTDHQCSEKSKIYCNSDPYIISVTESLPPFPRA